MERKVRSLVLRFVLLVFLGFLFTLAVGSKTPQAAAQGLAADSTGRRSPAGRTGSILYVDASANGANTGASWEDAFTNLQDALTAAVSEDEIWVADGLYLPSLPTDELDPRTKTFQLKADVALYGGFAGGEAALDDRDPDANLSILSGDLDGNDLTDPNGVVTMTANLVGNNAYHVVSDDQAWPGVATLDGFTITAGYANGPEAFQGAGGGIFVYGAYLDLANLVIIGNRAESVGGGIYALHGYFNLADIRVVANRTKYAGGGIFLWWGSGNFQRTTFMYNYAQYDGAGLYAEDNAPVLSEVVFQNNVAGDNGGGFYARNSTPTLTNSTFSGNQAFSGGGMAVEGAGSAVTLQNSILWGNVANSQIEILLDGVLTVRYSLVQGSGGSGAGWQASQGTDGGQNLDTDPLFVLNPSSGDGSWVTMADNVEGDLHLQQFSPAADEGDNAVVTALVDYDGQPRLDNGSVDLGAFEVQGRGLHLGSVSELPESAGAAGVPIILDHALPVDASLAYTLTVGTASALDFTPTTGRITVTAGLTQTLAPVTIVQDALDELGETFHLELGSPQGTALVSPASAWITILDDDDPPEVRFYATTLNTTEETLAAGITIKLTEASALTVTVMYSTTQGTATPGVDYTPSTELVTFPPGTTNSYAILYLIDDLVIEPDETVGAVLLNPVNATLFRPPYTTATITIAGAEENVIYLPLVNR